MNEKSWNIIYNIINDFTCSGNLSFPECLLYDVLENNLPADKGLYVVQMNGDIPYCIRWPDYASKLIPLFNNRLNKNAPAVYNPATHLLGPVNWKNFADTEYDSEFNRPLNISCSAGFDIRDVLKNRTIIFVVHDSRVNRTLISEYEQLFCRIQPLLQNLFDMRCNLVRQHHQQILPVELETRRNILSNREREILQFLLSRIKVKNIAAELDISPRTVETHVLHIYQKLDVSSRKELQHKLL